MLLRWFITNTTDDLGLTAASAAVSV